MKNKKVETLYKELADITRKKCAGCNVPFGCCDSFYCEMAEKYAKNQYGVDLTPTGFANKKGLKFMSENGCIVPPHLRPVCTIHICDKALYADPKFHDKYFSLREKLDCIELEEQHGTTTRN